MNPRQVFKFFRFFALDTNCLQIVPSKTDPSILRKDSNPRNPKKSFFRNRSIVPTKGFEPANPKYCPTEDKEKATANRGIFFQVKLPDKLEFDYFIRKSYTLLLKSLASSYAACPYLGYICISQFSFSAISMDASPVVILSCSPPKTSTGHFISFNLS